MAADSLMRAGAYQAAIDDIEQALASADDRPIGDSLLAAMYDRLGQCYLRISDNAHASEPLTKALQMRIALFGTNHPDVATSMYYMAVLKCNLGELQQAESLYVACIGMRERLFGPDHLEVGRALIGYSSLALTRDDIVAVDSLSRQALAILEANLEPDDPELAKPLINLAGAEAQSADYLEAEKHFTRALHIQEAAYGPDHPILATVFWWLGNLYYEMGQYYKALPSLERARDMFSASLGPKNIFVSDVLTAIGGTLSALGKYDEAVSSYREALPILEKAYGEDHPRLAGCLDLLAETYSLQGKYPEAERLYVRALNILENSDDTYADELAGNLEKLADIYFFQKKYATADTLYARALSAMGGSSAETHPRAISIMMSQAALAGRVGNFQLADSLFARALTFSERILGHSHQLTAEVLEWRARDYRRQGRFADGCRSAQQAFDIRLHNLQAGVQVIPEQDALAYGHYMRTAASLYLSSYFDLERKKFSEEAADIVLTSKGKISDGIFLRNRSLAASSDPQVASLANEYRRTKLELSEQFTSVDRGESSVDRLSIDSLHKRLRSLEMELAGKSAALGPESDSGVMSYRPLTDMLPDSTAVIEYMRFDYFDRAAETTRTHYLALVLRARTSPVLTDLGAADIIDSAVAEYRRHMLRVAYAQAPPTQADLDEYRGISMKLARLSLDPLKSAIDASQELWIAPDGALNLVSFAGLNTEPEKYLIEDHAVHYFSSARDIARYSGAGGIGSGLFLLGDPDFDALPEQIQSTAQTVGNPNDDDASNAIRSGMDDCDGSAAGPLPRLAGSRSEVEKVQNVWKDQRSGRVDIYLGAAASEDRFKREAPGHLVLHLATHGYYRPSRCYAGIESGGDIYAITKTNPLLFSGLYLAGANRVGQDDNAATTEDGVLTAEEVTTMDLSGTQWIVLSACESGLGQVEFGEGVYGLRRAFQLAGVRTIISSLWPIPDAATANMMAKLYKAADRDLGGIVADVARQQIQRLRRKNQPDHPYYWAGFISIGDWRPLHIENGK